MTKIQLTNLIVAEICPNYVLNEAPRWFFEHTIIVGPYRSMNEHETHIVRTVGSFDYFTRSADEIRFSEMDLVLESVWFRVPTKNVSGTLNPERWISVLPEEGILRLSSSQDFFFEPVDCLWTNSNSSYLLGLMDGWQDDFRNPIRLRIAKDIDLLFSNGAYCGWMLTDPIQYIVESFEFPQKDLYDKELPGLVSEYLKLVTDELAIRMEDGDVEARNELTLLRSKVEAGKELSIRREILLKQIDVIFDTFYD
jgi:hypothetical protein